MPLTIAQALQQARQQIAPASQSAALDAQILLAETLGVSRAHLLTHPEQPLTAPQLARFTAWVERCASGEPLAYLLGRRGFYDRDLVVTPAVLVPRPETERLLEHALDFARQHPGLTAVDVGTGSGALAVTFAALQPTARIYAVDISSDALAVAQHNAALHAPHIHFMHGHLLQPLITAGIRVQLIMANLPYIPSAEVDRLPVSQHEPRLALDGGADGLGLIRQLLAQASQVTTAGARLLLEIGYDQGESVPALAREHFPHAQIHLWQDDAGLDRIVSIDLN